MEAEYTKSKSPGTAPLLNWSAPVSTPAGRDGRPIGGWHRGVARTVAAAALLFVPVLYASDRVVVQIEGVDDELRDNVLKFLSIEKLANVDKRKPLTELLQGDAKQDETRVQVSDDQIRRAHRRAPDQIRQALQPFGFYNPVVDASLGRKDDVWHAQYRIDPGVATTLAESIRVDARGEGRDDPVIVERIDALREEPLSQAGAVLSHAHYETTKSTLLDLAFNNGYVQARYSESVIRVDRRRNRAEIVLVLETGPRFVFGEVTINQSALRPEILDRFVTVKTGEAFDSRRLNDLQIALEGSGYFDSVVVQPALTDAVDGQVPVTVETRLQKPRHYSAAFGFGTDTGPRVKLSADFRRINDRGHKIKADARASALGVAVSGQYEVPSWQRSDERWVYNLHFINDDVVDQDTRQYSLGASRFDAWRGFVRQFYSNLSRERFDIGSDSTQSTLLVSGASLRRHSADDPLFIRRGYSVLIDLHGGHDSLGSDTSFAQASVTLRAVRTVTDKTRLLGHFAYGVTTVDDFNLLPLGERFFAGGDRSVRGYKYQSLSPEDAEGNAIGGRFMIAAGIEVERMIRGNYGVAGFIDTGNASDDTLPELKTGIGLGLRYRAPIGMVRLDVAHPLDDDEHDYRLHISIGGDL